MKYQYSFLHLGTLSVLYVVGFTIYKSAGFGVNVDFSGSDSPHKVERKSSKSLKSYFTLLFVIYVRIQALL